MYNGSTITTVFFSTTGQAYAHPIDGILQHQVSSQQIVRNTDIALSKVKEPAGGPSRKLIIGLSVGLGGLALLIVVVVIVLCIHKNKWRRKAVYGSSTIFGG